MKLDPELKKAISLLPSEEKDKIIFRLLRHDLDFANRLYFELLSTESVQDRRTKMEDLIKKYVQRETVNYYSPGYLLIALRDISGRINEHVRITKDKYGEASLNLLMLNEAIKNNSERILQSSPKKAYTLGIYIIARAFKILILVKSLHEDYLVEFEEELKSLGMSIGGNPFLMNIAIHNGLDVNWLCRATIPDDIVDIHKEIRARGFLR